jgi:hypothetical protein
LRFHIIAVLAAGALPAIARAQSPERIPIPYRTYVAVNPLGIPFDIVSAEIESAVAPGITVGALASYTSIDGDRYTTVDGTVRYYPGEVVLRGFSLGASIGRTHFRTKQVLTPTEELHPTADFATLGLLVDYNWMLGARRRFIVGGGVGGKRVLANAAIRERVGIDKAYATVRFVVGIAF